MRVATTRVVEAVDVLPDAGGRLVVRSVDAILHRLGLLLGLAGDKVGANSALFKACSAGDAEACKPAK